jgi:hypothetical protein
MSPKRNPNSTRRPPVPAEDHSDIERWISRMGQDLQPIVASLDEQIRAGIPGLQYAFKWKRPFYGLPKLGWVIELAAYSVSVNVAFPGGADFDSPPPLGELGRGRYVKVRTLEEAQTPEMTAWISQAAHAPGWTAPLASSG